MRNHEAAPEINGRRPALSRAGRWALSAAITLFAILLPFVLFQESLDAWTLRQLQTQSGSLWIALLVVTLLMVDLLLPIPSSVVSTMAGALLGVPLGFAASFVGMTLGTQVGYLLGRWYGVPLAQRLISEQELVRVSSHVDRRGIWAFAVMRPIPVLAEASAFWAGVMLVNPVRFSIVTLLANAVVSSAYVAVGAAALPAESVTLILAGGIALPAATLLFGVLRRARSAS